MLSSTDPARTAPLWAELDDEWGGTDLNGNPPKDLASRSSQGEAVHSFHQQQDSNANGNDANCPTAINSRRLQSGSPGEATCTTMGTVVVRNAPLSSSGRRETDRWSHDTAELSELFGPSSLERLFQARKPPISLSSVFEQNQIQAQTPGLHPLQRTPCPPSGKEAPLSGKNSLAAASLLPSPSHLLPNLQSTSPSPFTSKLFGEHHDTWTRGRLSALMSELDSDVASHSPSTTTTTTATAAAAAAAAPLSSLAAKHEPHHRHLDANLPISLGHHQKIIHQDLNQNDCPPLSSPAMSSKDFFKWPAVGDAPP
ncbi:hypothetical protein BASA81_014777, partial [Batrachochytrium salamandrivorans]